jgi:hypothetical protein
VRNIIPVTLRWRFHRGQLSFKYLLSQIKIEANIKRWFNTGNGVPEQEVMRLLLPHLSYFKITSIFCTVPERKLTPAPIPSSDRIFCHSVRFRKVALVTTVERRLRSRSVTWRTRQVFHLGLVYVCAGTSESLTLTLPAVLTGAQALLNHPVFTLWGKANFLSRNRYSTADCAELVGDDLVHVSRVRLCLWTTVPRGLFF